MTKLNPQKMTMVVARYNENLDWLENIRWNYIVYNKGEDDLPKWIKKEIKLPNIEREAYTYLTFIIDNYDNLSDYSAFLQGDPFPPYHEKKELTKRLEEFQGGVDFYPLTQIRVGSHVGLSRNELAIAEVTRKFFLDEIRRFKYPIGAQFILSKKAVHFHTKDTYQKILELIEKPPLRKCTLASDISRGCSTSCIGRGWNSGSMERIWKVLFEHKTIYD